MQRRLEQKLPEERHSWCQSLRKGVQPDHGAASPGSEGQLKRQQVDPPVDRVRRELHRPSRSEHKGEGGDCAQLIARKVRGPTSKLKLDVYQRKGRIVQVKHWHARDLVLSRRGRIERQGREGERLDRVAAKGRRDIQRIRSRRHGDTRIGTCGGSGGWAGALCQRKGKKEKSCHAYGP